MSYLLFEIPTGIVADAVSRKRSVVIGFIGTWIAFVTLGLADSFGAAALTGALRRVRHLRERRGRRLAHR